MPAHHWELSRIGSYGRLLSLSEAPGHLFIIVDGCNKEDNMIQISVFRSQQPEMRKLFTTRTTFLWVTLPNVNPQ